MMMAAEQSGNMLILAADRLLALTTILGEVDFPKDPQQFLVDLAQEIARFEIDARLVKYEIEQINLAKQLLVLLIDNRLIKTSWGSENNWQGYGLINFLHLEELPNKAWVTLIEQKKEGGGGLSAEADDLVELFYVGLGLDNEVTALLESGEMQAERRLNLFYRLAQFYDRKPERAGWSLLIEDENHEQKRAQDVRVSIKTKYILFDRMYWSGHRLLMLGISVIAFLGIMVAGANYFLADDVGTVQNLINMA